MHRSTRSARTASSATAGWALASAVVNASRSASGTSWVNSSSSWSTTSSSRPAPPGGRHHRPNPAGARRISAASAAGSPPTALASASASAATGFAPGLHSTTGQPPSAAVASAGSSPARSSDDLPEPDAPTRITGSGVSSCSVIRISRSVTACWRPWNQPASACSKPRSPGYGPSAAAAGAGGRAPVLRRIARTRWARSCPGSGPDAVASAIPLVVPAPRAALRRLDQLADPAEAPRRLLRHPAQHDRVQLRRDRRHELRRSRRWPHQVRRDRGHRFLLRERQPPGEAFEQHAGQRVLVGPAVHLLPGQPLRSEVVPAAQQLAGGGQVGRVRRHRPRDAEVGQVGVVARGDQDVGRLHVAVHQAGGVRRVQRPGHLPEQVQRPQRVQLAARRRATAAGRRPRSGPCPGTAARRSRRRRAPAPRAGGAAPRRAAPPGGTAPGTRRRCPAPAAA